MSKAKSTLIISFVLSIAFIWGTYRKMQDIHLPNGYFMTKVSLQEIAICSPGKVRSSCGSFVIGPNIVEYAIHDQYVIGRAEKMRNPEYPNQAGYFILNTDPEDIIIGLDKKTWGQILHDKRITSGNKSIYLLRP